MRRDVALSRIASASNVWSNSGESTLILPSVSGFALVAHRDDPNQMALGRVFVERDVSGVSMRDDELPQGRPRPDASANFGMTLEDFQAALDLIDVSERGGGIPGEIELPYSFEVGERFLGENDHASRRDFGRAGFCAAALART